VFTVITEYGLEWVVAGAGGLIAGYVIRMVIARALHQQTEKKRQEVIDQAKREGQQIKRELEVAGRQEVIKLRENFEKDMQECRRELRQTERRLDKREDNIDKRQKDTEERERFLETAEKNLVESRKQLADKEKEIEQLKQAQKDELYRISGLSLEDARKLLFERLKRDVEEDCADIIESRIADAKSKAEREAQKILVGALERCAADSTSEATVCTVELPSDDLKGRIIGREGRNIRSFEKATGVDVIVDDTPGVVVLSSFDSVRREIARVAMQRLISDGRIHPGRIEEVTDKATEEVEKVIFESGKEAAYEMGLTTIADGLKSLIGRLRFRTSYGQNVLQHSIEVGHIAGLIASEVGLDVRIAKRAGLLHDIGKALDHEQEGSHAILGAEEARRWGEDDVIVNAIEAHHEDVDASSLYAGIILAADTMSASRPGARRETLERYIKRLERLEGVANRHKGVKAAYAIQAGREIRVLVNADKVNDKTASRLSHEIAREIEDELQYPGEVQVTVIRESRYTEVAH
jgi:ribonuclease Y